MTLTARDFLDMRRADLIAVMREGHPVDPAALDDTEYRGIALGLPGWVERLAWKTFKKVFHRDPATGHLRGWNIRLVQDGLDGRWEPMTKHNEPKTFGHYRVVPLDGYRPPKPVGGGLMLDYALGGNPALDFTRCIRDPIVAVEEGRDDLLLGWTYLRLVGLPISTPSYFILERGGPLTHRVAPPRRPRSP